MNNRELIQAVATNAGLKNSDAAKAVRAVRDAIAGTLRKGGAVALAGVGVFAVGKRAARVGTHPKTGLPINISARKIPKFKPCAALKAKLN